MNEAAFQRWYAKQASALGLDPDPDAPEHFYDYRAAFESGATPDKTGHWPSEFKREGHPRMVIDGVNTKTGQPVKEGYLPADWGSDAAPADAEYLPEQEVSGWEAAKQAIASAFSNPNLGMRAANPFAPGVSSQGTEAITEPYGSDPRAAGYADDAATAAAINSGLSTGLGVGGIVRAGIVPAAKVLGGSLAGGYVGEKGGSVVGLPGVGKFIGAIGGGIAGGIANPRTVVAALSELGVPGLGGRLVRRAMADAPKAAQVAAKAKDVATAAAADARATGSGAMPMGPVPIPSAGSYGRISVPAPPAAAPASAASPKLNPAEIQNYVMTMRQQHGLSGAQITDFLRSKYGIPLKDGSKMVKMILEAQ